MSFIRRLSTTNPPSASPFSMFTSDGVYVCSVIAANRGDEAVDISLWIDPGGNQVATDYGYILSELPIDPADSYETFRFAVNNADVVYGLASTASVSFNMFGINQTTTTASVA